MQLIGKYDAIIRSWPVPCEERDVATTFGTTHIVVSGSASAPPLVLLRGACTTSAMWSPIIAPPAGSYRCYCIDTITDGSKCVPAQRVTGASGHVDWLREIFSALGIDNARVAGLSYGGWLAALLAVHAPELVNRLVLFCPAGTFAPLSAGFMVRIGIEPPEVVVIGDREVLYRGGPEAALARAQRLIPNVRAHLVPGANHILTLDCPETVVIR